jgi:hypothetical protein
MQGVSMTSPGASGKVLQDWHSAEIYQRQENEILKQAGLQEPIFNTQAQETVQNCSNYALVVVSRRVSRRNSSDAIRRGGVNGTSVVLRTPF